MEQAGFVHGDLAARNCLVANPAGKVVVGDYGYSVQKYKADYYYSSGCAIPIRWAAPETIAIAEDISGSSGTLSAAPVVIKPLEVTHTANIWSLGVVIWEIYQLGKLPYENLTNEHVIQRVIQQGFILEPPQLPFVSGDTRERIYHLLVSCWNSTPAHRPSIEAVEELFTTPT